MNLIQKSGLILDELKDILILISQEKQTFNQKKILISGLPRSGTTWFGSMLNTSGNLVFHEPFINKTQLWNWNLDITKGENLDAFKKIFNQIETNNYWNNYQKKTNNKQLAFKKIHNIIKKDNYNLIIKDPGVVYLLDSFNSLNFDEVILIYRNPLSVIGSLYKNQWDPTERLERIAIHPQIKFKNKDILQLLNKVDQLSMIEKIALQTGILQVLMEENIQDCKVVKYEEFANNPIEKFQILFKDLGLVYNAEVEKYHIKLTKSVKKEYSIHDIKRNSSEFVDIYKKYLTQEQINQSKIIYNKCNPHPNVKYF